MQNIIASLAPMAGFTDAPFRRLVSSLGAAYVTSEMISSVALVMGDLKTATLAKISDGESPVYLQLFGHNPATMASAAEKLLSGNYPGCSYDTPPAGIDINMGCPVKKIFSSGDGSALMLNTPLAADITAAVAEICERYSVPLSVKIRAGVYNNAINAPDFAVALAKAGCRKITLHCRTKEQMYAPSAEPAHAKAVVDALTACGKSVPVVGNGDIDSAESAGKYLSLGCAEVAVGRYALGYPWIFSELSHPEDFTPPSTEEILSSAVSLVRDIIREKGETVGIRESRSRAAYFIRGMRGAAAIRDRLNHAEGEREFCSILEEFSRTLEAE